MIYGLFETCVPGNENVTDDLRSKAIAERMVQGLRVLEVIPCVCQLGEDDTRPDDYFSSRASDLFTSLDVIAVDTLPATAEQADAAGYAGLGCVAIMVRDSNQPAG